MDPALVDKYRKIRRMAQEGETGERKAANKILRDLEDNNPGLREYVHVLDNPPPTAGKWTPDWSKFFDKMNEGLDFVKAAAKDLSEALSIRQDVEKHVDIESRITRGKVTITCTFKAKDAEKWLQASGGTEHAATEVGKLLGELVASEFVSLLEED